MPEKSALRKVPAFATEAEEAKWWDDKREMVEDNLALAMNDGTIVRGAAKRLMSESKISKNITIRMAEADLNLARQQAHPKGIFARRSRADAELYMAGKRPRTAQYGGARDHHAQSSGR